MARGLRWLGAAAAMLAVPVSSSASLGGDAASVRADQRQMNATLRAAVGPNYTQYEIQLPSGTVAREYVSPAGQVFAVAWQGPSLPDLRQLLGRYFAQFVESETGPGVGARPRVIDQPGLILYAGGRMRAFTGRALIPELMPKGIGVEEIR